MEYVEDIDAELVDREIAELIDAELIDAELDVGGYEWTAKNC